MKRHVTDNDEKSFVFAFDTSQTLFATMLVLLIAVLVGYVEQKKQNEANSNTLGVYAIVIDWPNGSSDDVDLYVQDPNGRIVYFRAKDVDLMHLERDDQGTLNDTVMDQRTGQQITVQQHEERVILRGILPGEYIANVHMFAKADPDPTEVRAKLMSLKGEDTEVTSKAVVLAQRGDEQTVFRFTLSANGDVSDINYLQKKFVGAANAGGGN